MYLLNAVTAPDFLSDFFSEQIVSGAVSIVKTLITILLIWIIGKKIIKVTLNIVHKTFERTNMDVSLEKFLESLIKFALYAVLAVTIVSTLGIETTSIVTLIGSLGLTVGLSLQGSLSNFAGGVLILLFKPFRVGDYIVACGCEGTVEVIDLLYTKLTTVDNKKITIPNGTLANSNITNVAIEPTRRVDVAINVAYNTDLKKAKSILEEQIRAHKDVLKDQDVSVFVDVLGDSSITIMTRCWVMSENYWTVMWDLKESFKVAMDANNISIPYPQLDVHMK